MVKRNGTKHDGNYEKIWWKPFYLVYFLAFIFKYFLNFLTYDDLLLIGQLKVRSFTVPINDISLLNLLSFVQKLTIDLARRRRKEKLSLKEQK